MWREIADVFVGNAIDQGLTVLRDLQAEMDRRYDWLDAQGRRKIVAADGIPSCSCVIDELAYFSATVGTKKTQDEFINLIRDLVARGRAAGIIMVARHATARRRTSSPPACGTSSATGAPSAAPPTPAATSSWAPAGPSRATTPPTSPPNNAASAGCSPKAASPAGSKPPTCTDGEIRRLVARAKIIRGHR